MSPNSSTGSQVGAVILAIIVIAALGYGGFMIKRWFNYAFGYQSQVEESVRELVKPECLIEE